MTFSQFLDPKNDLAFKRIFGTERNKDIVIHFLNDIFPYQARPIEDVTFLKTAQDPLIAAQRVSLVDILCQDTHGNRLIVEIQVTHEPGFEKRAQYYAAKAYIEQRGKDHAYKDLKQVTFLAIMDFELFPHEKVYLSHHHILDTKTYERDLQDFSFSFLELPKFQKRKEDLHSMSDKWCFFFKHAPETQEEDLTKIIGGDLIIKRAYEELNRYGWSVEELRTYDSVDMKHWADKAILEGALERGIQKGREEGRAEGEQIGLQKGEQIGLQKGEQIGIEKEKVSIALKLLEKGTDLDTITEITGLSLEEIEQLKKDL